MNDLAQKCDRLIEGEGGRVIGKERDWSVVVVVVVGGGWIKGGLSFSLHACHACVVRNWIPLKSRFRPRHASFASRSNHASWQGRGTRTMSLLHLGGVSCDSSWYLTYYLETCLTWVFYQWLNKVGLSHYINQSRPFLCPIYCLDQTAQYGHGQVISALCHVSISSIFCLQICTLDFEHEASLCD